jgi:hypothetical protein
MVLAELTSELSPRRVYACLKSDHDNSLPEAYAPKAASS